MVDLRTIIDELNMLARHAGYHSSEVANRIESEGIAPPDGYVLVPIKTSERKRQLPPMLGNEPFSAQQLSDRMDAICGCKGKYDCDCTSISSMARIAMWTEHNQALNAAKDEP